jgi:hypothetical protein
MITCGRKLSCGDMAVLHWLVDRGHPVPPIFFDLAEGDLKISEWLKRRGIHEEEEEKEEGGGRKEGVSNYQCKQSNSNKSKIF